MMVTLVLIALALAGCAQAAPIPAPAPTLTAGAALTYIARIEGAPSSARAVIVVENGRFDAYVCSLNDAFNLTTARWYKGQLDASGALQATSNDGVEFKGRVQDGRFSGSIVNTQKQNLAFAGEMVPADGKSGLYRGVGKYNGEDVIVGAVLSPDGTFAATAQKKDKFEFVSPVANQPISVAVDTLGVKIGIGEQIQVKRVTTLQGPQIF
ncbi:MAG: hypothetical protein HY782_17310 [Chloroflexi bacterium]|nr:hypothetical protein [Chloroflexota bacterium]